MPRYAIVEAPSALGHIPEHLGVERAPEVLIAAGLVDGLAARRAGRVEAAGYRADRDSATHVMNPQAIRDYSPLLADAVTAVLGDGEFPVVLGGDCSILLGTMLALRRRGRYGLLYIDGDADFYQPEANPLNGAASASDLAFATGFGPDVVTDIEGRQPLVRPEDVVIFACRDAADRERRGCQPLRLPGGAYDIRGHNAVGRRSPGQRSRLRPRAQCAYPRPEDRPPPASHLVSFSRVLFRTSHLAVAGEVRIGRADGLRRRALRLQERVGYPVAESQKAGSGQCCRQGAAPPDGVG
jgi:arginase family protein